MTLPPYLQKTVGFLRCMRLPLNDEKQTQLSIADAFDKVAVPYEREVRLGPADIVDFLVDKHIALEVKLKRHQRAANVMRQLERYAKHDRVHALILATNLAMGLPKEINGKPAYYVSLGAAWL